MKKITLLSLCFATLFGNAQSVKLENGKTIKITTNVVSTAESPMGGESTNTITTTNTIKVTAVEDKAYKATNTVTRMVMDGEMMGQSMKFDSDKKEDMDGQIGQMLGASVNKPSEINIDKADGKVTEAAGAEKKEGMMGAMGGESSGAEAAFFVIPADKKLGDKWTVSSDNEGIKSVKNYELESLKDNIATILVTSTNKGNTTKEANGMSIEVTIDAKSTGKMMVDTNTGLVKQIAMDDETTGSMEAMGQSMPMNKKSKTTVTFE
jgi:Family of unknown function (DUF6263)